VQRHRQRGGTLFYYQQQQQHHNNNNGGHVEHKRRFGLNETDSASVWCEGRRRLTLLLLLLLLCDRVAAAPCCVLAVAHAHPSLALEVATISLTISLAPTLLALTS